MWASREMIQDSKDAQLIVKTTLRELFLYCIFLFIICYMTFTQYSPLNYRYTQMMRSLFENQEDITNYKGFWKVSKEVLYIFLETCNYFLYTEMFNRKKWLAVLFHEY